MSGPRIFIIAGDPSGDQLAAEVVRNILQLRPGIAFTGGGGPALHAAGVDLVQDLTRHSVIGLWEVLRRYWTFRRLFHQLLDRCVELRPDLVVGVDYGGFNLRFAQAIRERASRMPDWNPRIVQLVSPQVWASRPGRARQMEHTHNHLLSILPFEPAWYAEHAPRLPVEFIGHPIVDRHQGRSRSQPDPNAIPEVLLLPGSRVGELERHLPVLLNATARIQASLPIQPRLILPTQELASLANQLGAGQEGAPEPEVGALPDALQRATLALASTGTVTLECAWFQVPTIALYRTSWLTYEVGRRVVTVKYLAMPNLLANQPVMPEFIQSAATPEALSEAALALLRDPVARSTQRDALARICESLGTPGAAHRAAAAILRELDQPPR
jgi:lipid-A-disaccharide synthase